eukprot:SAG31_NODE_21619_length_545_cov_0.901345_2_plen_72_part_01
MDLATVPHVSFWDPASQSRFATVMLGVNSILIWVKLIAFLNVFPEMAMISKTIQNSYHDTISFAVLFFIIFV